MADEATCLITLNGEYLTRDEPICDVSISHDGREYVATQGI